jgi:ribosomal RNA-processing protein 17
MGRREKISVEYDEAARNDFVTGFRKRKQQRRKVAEHQRLEIERKDKLERRAERRAAMQERMADIITEVDEFEEPANKSEAFSDSFSKKAFGAAKVVVSTSFGLPDADEADEMDKDLEDLVAAVPPPAKRMRLSRDSAGEMSSASAQKPKKGPAKKSYGRATFVGGKWTKKQSTKAKGAKARARAQGMRGAN